MKIFRHCQILCLVTIMLSLFPAGNASGEQVAYQAGSFFRMGLGADRVGMGDCGVAMTAGTMNWYYNPAGLSAQINRQAALSYRSMALDRSIMYAGFSTPLPPKAGLAFGILRAGTDNIDGRDSNGNRFDMLSHSENVIHGSFSLQVNPVLSLGINIKWMINAIPDLLEDDKNLYAYGMGVDLGLRIVASKNLQFGLILRDLDSRYNWDTSDVWEDESGTTENEFPFLIRAGGAWRMNDYLLILSDVIVNPDLIGDDSEAFEPHVGAQYNVEFQDDRQFLIRAGFNGEEPTFGFGVDLGIRQYRARMDYAFLAETVSPGGSHLISWIFEF